ncbi:MAG: YciI family protein [Chitinophagales bacterium]
MTGLQNFMMIFRFEPNNDYQPTPEQMEAQNQQWGAFIGNLAIKERLVSTHQLGFSGKQIQADLSVVEGINIAAGMTLGGNMIVRAKTLDEAIEMAKGCPILNMGGTVEVRGILPM